MIYLRFILLSSGSYLLEQCDIWLIGGLPPPIYLPDLHVDLEAWNLRKCKCPRRTCSSLLHHHHWHFSPSIIVLNRTASLIKKHHKYPALPLECWWRRLSGSTNSQRILRQSFIAEYFGQNSRAVPANRRLECRKSFRLDCLLPAKSNPIHQSHG